MRPLPMGICWWCGDALGSAGSSRRYCSKRCRQAGYRARHRSGPTPEQLGADEILVRDSAYGPNARHYVALSAAGGQISWDLDVGGNLIPGTYHLSDRNAGAGGGHSSWDEAGQERRFP
jgi:hypothetical protein